MKRLLVIPLILLTITAYGQRSMTAEIGGLRNADIGISSVQIGPKFNAGFVDGLVQFTVAEDFDGRANIGFTFGMSKDIIKLDNTDLFAELQAKALTSDVRGLMGQYEVHGGASIQNIDLYASYGFSWDGWFIQPLTVRYNILY